MLVSTRAERCVVNAATRYCVLVMLGCLAVAACADEPTAGIDLGDRPAWLVGDMAAGPLRNELASCLDRPTRRTGFSIGHRGAGIVYPEHTREAYEAGYRMGAGMLECDVTFTSDGALVCRHAQNDLATTTDILLTPLAAKCVRPFTPAKLDANGRVVRRADAECRTSELTLAEFKTLRGKIDEFDPAAATVERFVAPARSPRTGFDARVERGTLLTHAESIALFKQLGVRMTPELKEASVELPFRGLTRAALAQRLIDEYVAAGVPPTEVWPQSFERGDLEYWLEHEPEFGAQAVLLDDAVWPLGAPRARRLARYRAKGIRYWAPPLFLLLDLDRDGRIVPSRTARRARAAGLEIIAWTLERSGDLGAANNGFYYQTIDPAVTREGDVFEVLDALAREVGVRGVFSDWPATVSFYASCTGLP
jgi:glycerophosphoryl diester phosphodiesterase